MWPSGQNDLTGLLVAPDEDLVALEPKIGRQTDGLAGAVVKKLCCAYGLGVLAHREPPSNMYRDIQQRTPRFNAHPRRIRAGASPKPALNARLNADAEENPVRAAMSAIGSAVSSTSRRAAASRSRSE